MADLAIHPAVVPGDTLRSDPHAAMELLAAKGWQGTEQDHLGDWLLRAGHGFTGRANSALIVGDPGMPMPEARAAVVRWYDERGLRPCVQLPVPPSAAAATEFSAAGWTPTNSALVMTASLIAVLEACGKPTQHVQIAPTPGTDWLGGYQYRGNPLPAGAVHVLCNADDLGFAEIRHDGAVVAVARGAVNDGWLGVTAVTVDERHRRQGLARTLMAGLARWAQDRAQAVYLQVSPDNEAAIAMYGRLGFDVLHSYHYLVAPSGDAAV